MRKAGQGSKWIRKDKRLAIYLRDGMTCCYCGATFDEVSRSLTLDHVVAVELGGGDDSDNLVTCCLSCNSSKQDRPMRQWLAALRDKGVDTEQMAARVRTLTRRSLKSYRVMAKQILAGRVQS